MGRLCVRSKFNEQRIEKLKLLQLTQALGGTCQTLKRRGRDIVAAIAALCSLSRLVHGQRGGGPCHVSLRGSGLRRLAGPNRTHQPMLSAGKVNFCSQINFFGSERRYGQRVMNVELVLRRASLT